MPGKVNRNPQPDRIIRESQTIQAMVRIYCQDVHSPAGTVCSDCQGLIDYALARLERCPFQAEKPTCAKCTVHCYQPAMRERVRAVMRYAGPRMLTRHPMLSIRHLMDGMRKPPVLKRRKTG